MTPLQLAAQAGLGIHTPGQNGKPATFTGVLPHAVLRFYDLVKAEAVAAEREACAKVCEELASALAQDAEHGDHLEWQRQIRRTCSTASAACGESIRARGTKS